MQTFRSPHFLSLLYTKVNHLSTLMLFFYCQNRGSEGKMQIYPCSILFRINPHWITAVTSVGRSCCTLLDSITGTKHAYKRPSVLFRVSISLVTSWPFLLITRCNGHHNSDQDNTDNRIKSVPPRRFSAWARRHLIFLLLPEIA